VRRNPETESVWFLVSVCDPQFFAAIMETPAEPPKRAKAQRACQLLGYLYASLVSGVELPDGLRAELAPLVLATLKNAHRRTATHETGDVPLPRGRRKSNLDLRISGMAQELLRSAGGVAGITAEEMTRRLMDMVPTTSGEPRSDDKAIRRIVRRVRRHAKGPNPRGK
jgi:hypothetical protein